MANLVSITYQNQRSLSNASEDIHMDDTADDISHRGSLPLMSCLIDWFQWVKFIQRPDTEQQYSVTKGPHVDSDVYISGTTDECGFKFGAQLRTFSEQQDGVMKYRHVLCHVIDGCPAAKMHVKNQDELLLLNDQFIPTMTHDEVLEQFKTIKADKQTTLTMDIRQMRKRKWKWAETSAKILTKDEIDDAHYDKLIQNRKTVSQSSHHYKVPGSQLYCAISGGRVSVGVMAGDDSDKTKTIWKCTSYWQGRGGKINFSASLCDVTKTLYIAIDKRNRVTVKNETNADWFAYSKTSSNTHFELNNMYLAYNHSTDEICVQKSKFAFEEIPLQKYVTTR